MKAVVATAPLKEEKKKKDLVADLLMEVKKFVRSSWICVKIWSQKGKNLVTFVQAASEDDEFHEIKPSKIDADDDEVKSVTRFWSHKTPKSGHKTL